MRFSILGLLALAGFGRGLALAPGQARPPTAVTTARSSEVPRRGFLAFALSTVAAVPRQAIAADPEDVPLSPSPSLAGILRTRDSPVDPGVIAEDPAPPPEQSKAALFKSSQPAGGTWRKRMTREGMIVEYVVEGEVVPEASLTTSSDGATAARSKRDAAQHAAKERVVARAEAAKSTEERRAAAAELKAATEKVVIEEAAASAEALQRASAERRSAKQEAFERRKAEERQRAAERTAAAVSGDGGGWGLPKLPSFELPKLPSLGDEPSAPAPSAGAVPPFDGEPLAGVSASPSASPESALPEIPAPTAES